MFKIALAEDNFLASKTLQQKLSHLSDVELVTIAKNGQDIVDQISKSDDIQLILMDIEMPILNGIEATRQLKILKPAIKIIIFTIYDDDDNIFEAIKAGADSYILKDSTTEKIYESIVDTMNGGSAMSPSIAQKTFRFLKNNFKEDIIEKNSPEYSLSTRETEILEFVSKGHTNKAIAELLFISPFTVKRHIENIYQKLQTHNRTELLDKARKGNLL